MIRIRELRRTFGPITAVDGITFDVDRGEVLGFLGPNGAGKSTTMKIITGFLPPTGGSVEVGGADVMSRPIEAKRLIGYLPEGAPAYPDMTPEAFLKFVGEIRGVANLKSRVDEVASLVHLEGVMRQPIETLSKGYKRRVGLAQAIIHDPDVLILDEPTDGLDPNQKHEVRALIRRMSGEKAIVLSTHILEEVDAVCSRAVIISRGKIVADGTPAELSTQSRHHNAVTIAVRNADDSFASILGGIKGVQSVELDDSMNDGLNRCVVLPNDNASIAAGLTDEAQKRGWDIAEFRVERGRLDDVFRSITEGDVAKKGRA